MSITIRPALVEDTAALHRLAAQTFPDAAPAYIPRHAVQSFIAENLSEEAFARYLSSPDYLVCITEKDGTPIGYTLIDISRQHNPENLDDAAYLSKFYLTAEARGTGAAHTMMQHVFARVKERGFTRIWLGTAKENHRANSFYAKEGFSIVGERRFEVAPSVFGEDYLRAADLAVDPAQ